MLSTDALRYTDSQSDFEAFLENDLRKDLLRFTTAGSVDDGKSTLIGRLLHDSKGVYEDQLAAVRKSRINRSGKAVDFSLLTDGLSAEREQGITIDVAYRYFSTPRRKFIIADTPGHEQYTRNMATGASTADLAIILIDATKGLLPQTHRHTYIASLLGIPHVVAAINKMDLAAYDEQAFQPLQRQFLELSRSLRIPFVHCIPISALEGDEVVTRGANMPWYTGQTLMELLETVEIRRPHTATEFRFPIQSVIRPGAHFRGFAGRVASGMVRPGDEVVALPSFRRTTVRAIVSYDGELEAAGVSQSVVLQLADEIDLSRGDMLVSAAAPPQRTSHFGAMVVWLDARALQLNRDYLLKHAGRVVKGRVRRIQFGVNVNDLSQCAAAGLEMNGIAAVEFETTNPIFFDAYQRNRATGGFIVIDPISNGTVGAGMITGAVLAVAMSLAEPRSIGSEDAAQGVTLQQRSERHGHAPGLFLVERACAERVEQALFQSNFEVVHAKDEHVPSGALPAVLSLLWSTGSVIVYSGTRICTENRAALESLAGKSGKSFFDFSDSATDGSPHRGNDVVERALKAAETLRVSSQVKPPNHTPEEWT